MALNGINTFKNIILPNNAWKSSIGPDETIHFLSLSFSLSTEGNLPKAKKKLVSHIPDLAAKCSSAMCGMCDTNFFVSV